MNSETFLLICVLLLAVVWALVGWQKGACKLIRSFLAVCFAMLASLYFWRPAAVAVKEILGTAAGTSAVIAFVLLFLAAGALASYAVGLQVRLPFNPFMPPGGPTAPERMAGGILGFATGMLLGGMLILLVSVGASDTPKGLSPRTLKSKIHTLPIVAFRFTEFRIARIPSGDRASAQLPSVAAKDFSSQPGLVWTN